MPRKLQQGTAPSAAPSKDGTADDLAVLHPEGTLQIAGRAVEIREYGYIEGLKLQAAIKPFLDGLFALFDRGSTPPSAEDVREMFIEHVTTVQWIVAQAITPVSDDPQAFVSQLGENAKWMATLNDIDGDRLTTVWWGVNSGFFTRRLRERALAAKARANQSASPGSTQT